MGFIKEPKGVDFIIESEPLSDEGRKEISQFIKKYKEQNSKINTKPRANRRRTTVKRESIN
ncbi:MAG: hypothetical protein Q4G48_02985 [Bacteroidia bacterium]|nr:hypothetical protein [Bacteroidia bacterium]